MRVSTMSVSTTTTTSKVEKLTFNSTPYQQHYDDYDYDDEDYSADTAWGTYNNTSNHTKVAGKSSNKIANEGALEKKTLQSVSAKVNLSANTSSNYSHATKNAIDNSEKKANQARNIGLCRDTRATVDQVLDPRTAQVLGKFFHHKLIDNLQGCISTGKEANVYFATSGKSEEELLEFVNWKVGTESIPSSKEIGCNLRANIFDSLEEARHATDSKEEEDNVPSTTKIIEGEDVEENAPEASFDMAPLNEKGNNKTIFKNNENDGNSNTTAAGSTSQFKSVPKKEQKKNLCLAVKIFNTSVLIFKDREKYVSGDIRFAGKRGQMKSSNARRMVPIWCEKEFRNLARLRQRAKFVKVPTPIKAQQNVLVMTLIGDHESGKAAPRIKDVMFENEGYSEDEASLLWDLLYLQCCRIVRDMYQNCSLVHGDLSEYNMLFYENEIYVIDVSQAVEMDHPEANDFLKRDCGNINTFFQKKGVSLVPLSSFYDYVTKESEERDIEEVRLEYEQLNESEKKDVELRDLQFVNTWVPSNLHQINELHLLDKEMDKIDKEESVLCSNLLAPSVKEKKEIAKKQLATLLEEEDENGDKKHKKNASSKKKDKHGNKKKNSTLRNSNISDIDTEAVNAESAIAAEKSEEPEKCDGNDKDDLHENSSSSSDGEDESDSDSDSDDEEMDGDREDKKNKHKHGERDPNMSKAEWKAKIKSEKSEKRETKIKKKDKKKAKKKAHAGRK